MPDYNLTPEEQFTIVKAFADDFWGGEPFRKMLRDVNTPEKFIKLGSAHLKGMPALLDAFVYFDQLKKEGYPADFRTATAAATGALAKYAHNEVGMTVIYGTGRAVVWGAKNLPKTPVTFGVLAIGGLGGVLIGGTVILKANQLGYQVALGAAEMFTKPYAIKTPPTLVEAYVTKPDGSIILVNHGSSAAEIQLFQDKLRKHPRLSEATKTLLADSLTLEILAGREFATVLNIPDPRNVPPHGLALFAHSNKMAQTEVGNLLVQEESKGETLYDVDWADRGVNLPVGDPRREVLRAGMATRDGMLTKEGRITSPTQNLAKAKQGRGEAAAPAEAKIPLGKAEDILVLMQNECQFGATEKALLTEIYKSVTVVNEKGQRIGLGELVTQILQDQAEEREKQKNFQDAQSIASTIAALGVFFGNEKYATFGYALGHLVTFGASIARATSGDPTAIAACVQSVLGLINLFNKKDFVDPNQIILDGLKHISEQIEDLRSQITQGFIKLDLKLNHVLRQMLEGFQALHVEIYVSRLVIDRKLNQIQHSIHQLSAQVNKQIYGLWLNPLIDARFAIANHKRRYGGNLQRLTYDEFKSIADILIAWATEKSADDNSTGAHLYYAECPAEKMLIVLAGAKPETIIGFLVAYAKDQLQVVFQVDANDIKNADIWLVAANAYDELISGVSARFRQDYDPNHAQFKALIRSGDKLLNFYKGMQNGIDLFDALLKRYARTLENIRDQYESLLMTMDDSKKMKRVDDAIEAEQNKIIENAHLFVLQCSKEIQVQKKNENPEVQTTINKWNNHIAKKVVPEYLREYETLLREDVAHGLQDRPLTLFQIGEYNYLLSMSVLFKNQPALAEKFQPLFRAEKLALGKLVFVISKYHNGLAVKPQNWTNPITITAANIVVTVTFQCGGVNNTVLPVATIYLQSSKVHPSLSEIIDAARIDSKYGEQYGHPFYDNAYSAIERIAYINAWLNAEVSRYEMVYQPNRPTALVISKGIKTAEKANVEQLHRDLRLQVAGPAQEVRYGLAFEQLKSELATQEVNYQLILAFGALTGLPEATLIMLRKLWNREYIIDLMGHLAQSLKGAAEEKADAEKLDSFRQALQIHLTVVDDRTEQSPHLLLPGGSISYIELLDTLYGNVRSMIDTPYTALNQAQSIIINNLRLLVSEERQAALGVSLGADFLADFSWHQPNIFNPQALPEPPKNVPYTADDIEKLILMELENSLQPTANKEVKSNRSEKVVVLPAHCPDADLPVFYKVAFEKSLEMALASRHAQDLVLLLPICFEREVGTPPSKENVWVLMVIGFSEGKAQILYFDPSNEDPFTFDVNLEYKNEDNPIENAFINQVTKVLRQQNIVGVFHIVPGVKLLDETCFYASGYLLVFNLQWILHKEAQNQVIPDVADMYERQMPTLKLAKSTYPNLRAVPMAIDFSSASFQAALATAEREAKAATDGADAAAALGGAAAPAPGVPVRATGVPASRAAAALLAAPPAPRGALGRGAGAAAAPAPAVAGPRR